MCNRLFYYLFLNWALLQFCIKANPSKFFMRSPHNSSYACPHNISSVKCADPFLHVNASPFHFHFTLISLRNVCNYGLQSTMSTHQSSLISLQAHYGAYIYIDTAHGWSFSVSTLSLIPKKLRVYCEDGESAVAFVQSPITRLIVVSDWL